jgi:hypothetical protein
MIIILNFILIKKKNYASSRYLLCDKKMIGLQRCASNLSNNDCPLGSARGFWQPYLVLLAFCILILFFHWFFFLDFILLHFYSRGLTIIIFLALFLWCRVVDFFRSLKSNNSTWASFFYTAEKNRPNPSVGHLFSLSYLLSYSHVPTFKCQHTVQKARVNHPYAQSIVFKFHLDNEIKNMFKCHCLPSGGSISPN